MKGRFRKGKKAFKTGRPSHLSTKYANYLMRRKKMAFKAMQILQVGMIARMGYAQVAMIHAQVWVSELEKALAIANVSVNTAQAVSKILN